MGKLYDDFMKSWDAMNEKEKKEVFEELKEYNKTDSTDKNEFGQIIVHIQRWNEHISVYIMEEHGYGMIRATNYHDNIKETILSDLYVTEEHRHKGLGNRLFQYALFFLSMEGAETFRCIAGSDVGKHIFKKHGFKKVGENEYLYTVTKR